jgi:hypothetical protein
MRACFAGFFRSSGASRRAGVVLALALFVCPAAADELADFHAAVEQASAQYNVAVRTLETSGPDETAAEVQHFRELWQAMIERFGPNRPAVFADDERYSLMMTDIDARIVGALIVISAGRREAARNALAPIQDTLSWLETRSVPPR